MALSSVSLWTRDLHHPEPTPAPVEPAPETPAAARDRWCSRCERHLPSDAFNRNQWWCRSCFHDYYRSDRERHRARNDALLTQRVDEARAHVTAKLNHAVCLDCGLRDVAVFEFDHIGEKRLEISTMINRGAKPPALDAEMAQCEIVCANCHRRRTAQRGNWRRLDLGVSRPFRSRAQERNMLHCYCVLLASGCVDCGETDLCVLDFDHLGDKVLAVGRLAHREVSLDRLVTEIRKCVVRCANCHRRRTRRART